MIHFYLCWPIWGLFCPTIAVYIIMIQYNLLKRSSLRFIYRLSRYFFLHFLFTQSDWLKISLNSFRPLICLCISEHKSNNVILDWVQNFTMYSKHDKCILIFYSTDTNGPVGKTIQSQSENWQQSYIFNDPKCEISDCFSKSVHSFFYI